MLGDFASFARTDSKLPSPGVFVIREIIVYGINIVHLFKRINSTIFTYELAACRLLMLLLFFEVDIKATL